MNTIKVKKWYVDADSGEEFTELLFIAEGLLGYGLSARIGLFDSDGIEEFEHRFWWKVVQSERGIVEREHADTFQECVAAVERMLNQLWQEFLEEPDEDN